MKKKTKILIYVITFIVVFLISALIRIMLLGSAPERLIKVEWDESVGEIYSNLDYENDNVNQYDLYIPSGLDKSENQYLILFIHGGSFNSGSKEDGESWCKYYATKWYITASVDYTLQNQGKDASIYLMNEEIENAVTAIKQKTEELGYHIAGMAPCGVSAGGTLAMNRLDSEEKFCKMMTGKELEDYDTEIQNISPACIVNEDSVPSLIGYGLIDHCVPLSQKYYLMEAYDRDNVMYDYIEFPKSNHGMYNDLDKLQEFLAKTLDNQKDYFQNCFMVGF